MEYKQLIRNNPTDENLTKDHSIWLASRIMPGKGNDFCSFCHYQIINNAATWICENSDLMNDALLGMNSMGEIINMENNVDLLIWNGCWTINDQPVIGRGNINRGLTTPLNTHNVGRKYKENWRAIKDAS